MKYSVFLEKKKGRIHTYVYVLICLTIYLFTGINLTRLSLRRVDLPCLSVKCWGRKRTTIKASSGELSLSGEDGSILEVQRRIGDFLVHAGWVLKELIITANPW